MLPFLPKILFSLKSSWHRYQPFIKIFIGFFLLGILFWRIPLPENLFSIVSKNLEWIGLAAFLGFLGHALSSLKLTILLRSMGTNISFLKVLRAYYIGTFFNNFLPTTIGGDVVKLQYIRTSGVGGYTASAGIVMERATGLSTAIALMGFVCLFGKEFISHLHIEPFRFHIATLCFAVLILSWGTYYLGGEKIQRRIKSARKSHSPKILGRFIKSLRLGAQKTEGIITAFIISLFFYLNMAILLWIACKSMGERVAFISTIKIIPFIVIVSAMPISIGGLGLKEGIRTLCLTAVGIPPGASFSIALLIRLIEWAHSGIGGFLYIIYANNSKPT